MSFQRDPKSGELSNSAELPTGAVDAACSSLTAWLILGLVRWCDTMTGNTTGWESHSSNETRISMMDIHFQTNPTFESCYLFSVVFFSVVSTPQKSQAESFLRLCCCWRLHFLGGAIAFMAL